MSPRAVRPPRRALAAAIAVALLLALPLASGCRGSRPSSQLIVSGSTTLLPIAEIASEMYQEQHPGVKVLVAGIGSSAGIEAVANGTADIGTSSRDLKPEEANLGLVDTPVAHDAIAVIVNPENSVDGLSKAQAAAIFEGRIRNWKEVGGRNLPIDLVNRDEASGTREAFSKIVLDKRPFDPTAAVLPGTGQVRSVVGKSPGAVGYISVGFVDESVKVVTIDGVAPTERNIASGAYPVSRVLHFFTKGRPRGLEKEFIDFVLSKEVQGTVVPDAGFLPISDGAK